MKTFVGGLFAVSTLTVFIATSIPSVSALSLSPAPNIARHLTHAHMAKVKRNMNKKRCQAKIAPGNDSGGGSGGGSGGSSGGGSGPGSPLFKYKKGLAFPNGCNELSKWSPEILGWHFNWRATPYGDCPNGSPPYIPMVWGRQQVAAFNDAVRQKLPPIVIFLNEPNLCDELGLACCVDAYSACDLWWQTVGPLQQRGVKVGSSATTSAPDGIDWERTFRSNCHVKPDFITAHFYGTRVEDFINYANGWHNAFPGEGIVFTEVGCQDFTYSGPQCDYWQIKDFIQRITHWCLITDWCWGITFFGAMLDLQNVNPQCSLMNWDYSANELGQAFLNQN